MGGSGVTPAIVAAHQESERQTTSPMIARSLHHIADSQPLKRISENGRFGKTYDQKAHVLFVIPGQDRFTPGRELYRILTEEIGLSAEQVVFMEDASHYLFGLPNPPEPPEEITTREGLKGWLERQAQNDPDLARVLYIAQLIGNFVDQLPVR